MRAREVGDRRPYAARGRDPGPLPSTVAGAAPRRLRPRSAVGRSSAGRGRDGYVPGRPTGSGDPVVRRARSRWCPAAGGEGVAEQLEAEVGVARPWPSYLGHGAGLLEQLVRGSSP